MLHDFYVRIYVTFCSWHQSCTLHAFWVCVMGEVIVERYLRYCGSHYTIRRCVRFGIHRNLTCNVFFLCTSATSCIRVCDFDPCISWDVSMKETKDILAETAKRITSLKSRVEDAQTQRKQYSITQTCTTAMPSNKIDKHYAATRGRACSGIITTMSGPNNPILKVTSKTNNCLRWMDGTVACDNYLRS